MTFKVQPNRSNEPADNLHIVDTALGSGIEVWFRMVNTGEIEVEFYSPKMPDGSECFYINKAHTGKIADLLRKVTAK